MKPRPEITAEVIRTPITREQYEKLLDVLVDVITEQRESTTIDAPVWAKRDRGVPTKNRR
jgi:predicted secreted protein